MWNFATSSGFEWHVPQVSASRVEFTADAASLRDTSVWMSPWQLMQVGASAAPFIRARPWMLVR